MTTVWHGRRAMRALIALVIVVAGCGGAAATPLTSPPAAATAPLPTVAPATAAPTPAPTVEARAAVTRSGQGIMTTDKFTLAGDYRIDWSAADSGSASVGCYHGGGLLPGNSTLFNASVDGGQMKEGETYVYGLDAGEYYLDMSSGCEWTVTLTPV